MKISIQIKFKDPTFIPPCTLYCQDSDSLLLIRDVLEWFARFQKISPDAILSCFGLCKSLKSMDFLPLDQPIVSLARRSIWRQNFTLVLYIAFWRLPLRWNVYDGLGDERVNRMLFLELRERYLSQRLLSKARGQHQPKFLERHIKTLFSLSSLLRLVESWLLKDKEWEFETSTLNLPNSPLKRYIPHEYYSLLSESHWKKNVEDREMLWMNHHDEHVAGHDQFASHSILVQWITFLMVLAPFSFWQKTFHVKYLQLTGMTPEKEYMIRQTRYRFYLSISVDGLKVEWPESESKKEGKSMEKSNDSSKHNVLEGSHSRGETAYFPFGWIQAIRLLSVPTILAKSDASSSQVFINEDDLLGSSSALYQNFNVSQSTGGLGVSPLGFASTSPIPQVSIPINGARSSIHSSISSIPSSLSSPSKSPISKSDSSTAIVYIRLAANVSNSRRSIPATILVKMTLEKFHSFQSQYEYYRDLKYAFMVREYFNGLIKQCSSPFMGQLLMDCGWKVSVAEYEALSCGSTSYSLPVRVKFPVFDTQDDHESDQEYQIWAMNPYNSCDCLLKAVCGQNNLDEQYLLFGIQCDERWLDMRLSLLGQGYHFLLNKAVLRMKWIVPISEDLSQIRELNRSFIDASFCHTLQVVSNVAVPMDRQTFVNLCISYLRMIQDKPRFKDIVNFSNVEELTKFMSNWSPLWKWLKKAKCSNSQIRAVLQQVYTTYSEISNQENPLLERIRLVNMFERKISFIYFSWQPNYHKVGVSPFGWTLQKKGRTIRQVRYTPDVHNGISSWKCICNGFHLQFSEVKNISDQTRRSGKADRLVLSDSYSAFALHSIQLSQLIHESFYLFKFLLGIAENSLTPKSDAGAKGQKHPVFIDHEKDDNIGRMSSCSLLMTLSPHSEIPKLPPATSTDVEVLEAIENLKLDKVHPCESNISSNLFDTNEGGCNHNHPDSIDLASDIHRMNLENNYSGQELTQETSFTVSESYTTTDNSACTMQESYQLYSSDISFSKSFKNLVGSFLGKKASKIKNIDSTVAGKITEDVYVPNNFLPVSIITTDVEVIHDIVHCDRKSDIYLKTNQMIGDNSHLPSIFTPVPNKSSPEISSASSSLSTGSVYRDDRSSNVINSEHTIASESTKMAAHISVPLSSLNLIEELSVCLPLSGTTTLEPSPVLACRSGRVKRMIDILEAGSMLSSSLTDLE